MHYDLNLYIFNLFYMPHNKMDKRVKKQNDFAFNTL